MEYVLWMKWFDLQKQSEQTPAQKSDGRIDVLS